MRLVARDASPVRDTNRLGEKQAAPIARITDTLGDTRSPRQPRRFKCVLEEHRKVESFATHLSNKFFPAPPSLVASGILVFPYLVCKSLVTIQVRYTWPRQYRNFRGCMCTTDRFKRRNRHHAVAHPIGGAHKNFHRAAPFRLRRTASVIAA